MPEALIPTPGKIRFAHERGFFNGCVAVQFRTVEEMNEYVEKNPKLVMVEWQTKGEYMVAIFAPHYEEEELEQMAEWNQDWLEFREGKLRERKKVKDEAHAAQMKLEQERADLLKLGEQCRANHGAVIEDNKKLKSENAKLRKR